MSRVASIKESLDLEFLSKSVFSQIKTIQDHEEEIVSQLNLHPDCGDCLEVACAIALLLHERAPLTFSGSVSKDFLAAVKSSIEVTLLVRVYENEDREDLVHASASLGERFIGLDRLMDNLALLWQEKDEADDLAGRYEQHYEMRSYTIEELIQSQGKHLIDAYPGMTKNHNTALALINWDSVLGLKQDLVNAEQSIQLNLNAPQI